MPFLHRQFRLHFLNALFVFAIVAGCSGDGGSTAPRTGAIHVIVETNGDTTDRNGYLLTVSNGPSRQVHSDNEVVITGIAAGVHTVTLSNLDSFCTEDLEGLTRQVTVVAGDTSTVDDFTVRCLAPRGNLTVTSITTGVDIDGDGYRLDDGRSVFAYVDANGTFVEELPFGTYAVRITGVARNCTVSGPVERTVTISASSNPTIAISVDCVAVPVVTGFPFDDPAGDTLPTTRTGQPRAHDLLAIRGLYVADSVIVTLRFAGPVGPPGQPNALFGYLQIDSDEDAQTGTTPASNYFGGNSRIGVDFTVYLDDATASTVPLGAVRIPISFAGDSVVIRIPLARLNNDDGNFRLALALASLNRRTDFAPNDGNFVARRPAARSSSVAASDTSGRPFSMSRAGEQRQQVVGDMSQTRTAAIRARSSWGPTPR